MTKLTSKQARVLEAIRQHIGNTGFPPTRAELASALGFRSANAAEEHLRALSRKGAIKIVPGTSRGIRLVESLPEAGIPIIGRVAAGEPILAEEHIHDYCNIPPTFFKPTADYFLEVCGDSMINAGIFDGDLLAVHKTKQIKDGQIVIARIEDEVTVKRYQRTDYKTIHLIAENPDYPPLKVNLAQANLAIEGLSVGIIRRNH